MPARSRRRKRIVASKKKHISKKLLILFCLILGVLIIWVFIRTNRKYWKGGDKLAVVIQGESGEVEVVVFDSNLSEITKIIIPEDTEISVSRQLGNWKVGSLWELGKNEGVGGKLLTESVTKYFRFPVYVWSDMSAESVISGNLTATIKFILLPFSTNLSLSDKISLALFSFKIPNSRRVIINLADTSYLQKATLSDGASGYERTQTIPNTLLAIFSNRHISEGAYRVSITDETGTAGLAEDVGEILSVMGAKLASIKREETKDYGCYVSSDSREVTEQISDVFSCETTEVVNKNEREIEIKLGKKFSERF